MVFATGPDQTLLCFERGPKGRRRADDAAVWDFDPARGSRRTSDSFDAWLREYLEEVYGDEDSRWEMDEVADQAVGQELKIRPNP
jgi:hypothetical protein